MSLRTQLECAVCAWCFFNGYVHQIATAIANVTVTVSTKEAPDTQTITVYMLQVGF